MKNKELVVVEATEIQHERDIEDVVLHRAKVQELMNKHMKIKEHYGKIFDTQQKPSLYKAGAEYIAFMFRLTPFYEFQRFDMKKDHMRYVVTCKLRHTPTDKVVGEGIGSCTSMESKYRFRKGKEITAAKVPASYWNQKRDPAVLKEFVPETLEEGATLGVTKTNDGWFISIDRMEENDNPADLDNTILKMAKKRAYVDAVISNTAASDFFTQDLEDIKANEETIKQYKQSKEVEFVNVAEEADVGKTYARPQEWLNYLDEMGKLKKKMKELSENDNAYYVVLRKFKMEKANDIEWDPEKWKDDIYPKTKKIWDAMFKAMKKLEEKEIPLGFKNLDKEEK